MTVRASVPVRADIAGGRAVHGGRTKALVVRVDKGGRPYAVKDVSGLRRWRRLFGRWILRREACAYEALRGLPGFAVSYGLMDRDALMLGFLDGDVVRRESVAMQREDFFDRLCEVVAGMHARGWVHLDLGHRRNVLVLADGSPAVIDLATAMPLAHVPLLGRVGRWIDRRAVQRLKRRYARAGFASGELAS